MTDLVYTAVTFEGNYEKHPISEIFNLPDLSSLDEICHSFGGCPGEIWHDVVPSTSEVYEVHDFYRIADVCDVVNTVSHTTRKTKILFCSS